MDNLNFRVFRENLLDLIVGKVLKFRIARMEKGI